VKRNAGGGDGKRGAGLLRDKTKTISERRTIGSSEFRFLVYQSL